MDATNIFTLSLVAVAIGIDIYTARKRRRERNEVMQLLAEFHRNGGTVVINGETIPHHRPPCATVCPPSGIRVTGGPRGAADVRYRDDFDVADADDLRLATLASGGRV